MDVVTSESIKRFIEKRRFDDEVILKKDPSFPKISIITPSYNQGEFLERTILSVLNQNYPNLEYIVIDGGSTDGSVATIQKYSRFLSFWISEKDSGQSDGINKGFAKATGELVAWQNSDDLYLEGAFARVAKAYRGNPGFDVFFGNMHTIDKDENILHELRYMPFSLSSLLYDGWNITNQSAFFHSRIVKKYSFDTTLQYAMDGDFFIRMSRDNRKFKFIHAPLGAFRIHGKTKGETIGNSIGANEWTRIRKAAGVNIREDIPWSKQFRARKACCKLRKLFYYTIQGDIDYIANRLKRELTT